MERIGYVKPRTENEGFYLISLELSFNWQT